MIIINYLMRVTVQLAVLLQLNTNYHTKMPLSLPEMLVISPNHGLYSVQRCCSVLTTFYHCCLWLSFTWSRLFLFLWGKIQFHFSLSGSAAAVDTRIRRTLKQIASLPFYSAKMIKLLKFASAGKLSSWWLTDNGMTSEMGWAPALVLFQVKNATSSYFSRRHNLFSCSACIICWIVGGMIGWRWDLLATELIDPEPKQNQLSISSLHVVFLPAHSA